MSIEENKYDLIEDYILGKLEGSVKKDFEDLLRVDAELRSSVKEYKLMIEGTRYSGRKKLIGFLQNIEKNRSKNSRPAGTMRSLYYGIAAAIILLIAFYVVIDNSLQKSPVKLAEAYYEPYPALYGSATRGVENNLTELEQAMNLYESAQYQAAIDRFQKLDNTDQQELIIFYMANSYLGLDNFNDCEVLYRTVIDTGEIFPTQAKWYLALAYLQDKKTEQAAKLLQDLVAKNSEYSEKSSKLLKSINYQP